MKRKLIIRLTSVSLVILLCWALSQLIGSIAQAEEEAAMRNTNALLDGLQTTSMSAATSWADDGCRRFLKTALDQNHNHYTIIYLYNSYDDPQAFRDVQDVWLQITFPDQQIAHVHWYAGGLQYCGRI